MFGKGIIKNEQTKELKQKLSLFNKNRLYTSWIFIRFCEMCGIVLSPNTVQYVNQFDGIPFEITNADVLDFVPNIKNLPIVDYYTGLYWFKQSEKVEQLSSKANLLQNAIAKLSLVLNCPFPKIWKYYSKCLLMSVKFDKNVFYDPYLVIDVFKKQLNNKRGNSIKSAKLYLDFVCSIKSAKLYLDFVCSMFWKIFLEQEKKIEAMKKEDAEKLIKEFKEQKQEKIKQNELIENIYLALTREQKNYVLGCTPEWESIRLRDITRDIMFALIESTENVKEENLDLPFHKTKGFIKEIEDTHPELIQKTLKESLSWDVDKDFRQWLFSTVFSFEALINGCKKLKTDDEIKEINLFELFTNDPLNASFFGGHVASFKSIIADYRLTHIIDKEHRSILHSLAESTMFVLTNEIEFVIKQGGNIEARDLSGRTPLCSLCNIAIPRMENLKKLIEKNADINAKTHTGLTPLHLASMNSNVNVVKYLLEKNASPDLVCVENETPLHKIAKKGEPQIANLLLNKCPSSCNQVNEAGRTPLWEACWNSNVEVIKVLIDYKADINKPDDKVGATPLYIACQNGHEIITKILLSKGAKIDAHRQDGSTPLIIACQNGHKQIAELLLSEGAKIDAPNQDGSTPLFVACNEGHYLIVQLLLSKGAKIEASNQNGSTPLYIACQNGHYQIAELLLSKGANIDAPRQNGITPLQIACYNSHKEVVFTLISRRANILLKSQHGTALSMSSNAEIKQILQKFLK